MQNIFPINFPEKNFYHFIHSLMFLLCKSYSKIYFFIYWKTLSYIPKGVFSYEATQAVASVKKDSTMKIIVCHCL